MRFASTTFPNAPAHPSTFLLVPYIYKENDHVYTPMTLCMTLCMTPMAYITRSREVGQNMLKRA